jgi:hypothetical protein
VSIIGDIIFYYFVAMGLFFLGGMVWFKVKEDGWWLGLLGSVVALALLGVVGLVAVVVLSAIPCNGIIFWCGGQP